MDLDNFILKEQGTKCKGIVVKANISMYRTKRGIAKTIKLDIMKRLSCSGCNVCGGLHEYMIEDTYCGNWPEGGLVDGRLYEYVLFGSTDYWGEWDGYSRLVEYRINRGD